MKTKFTRREVIRTAGIGAIALLVSRSLFADPGKTHIITLSFDDGFEKSSIKTCEIYAKYGLSACINIIATAHNRNFKLPNEYHNWKTGDFSLWNELQSHGHEIMPHSYDHQDLSGMSLDEARNSILKCLEIFGRELKGFDAKKSVYNFAYNRSTPEIEEWLATQVKAFRTGGPAVNPLPCPGQTKLTCISHGPENADQHLGESIDKFLEGPPGWFIYNTHGLDDEGWGPIGSVFLDELLDRLSMIKTVEVMPAGKVLNRMN